MKIRHLIFDLDDTLLDTTQSLLSIANSPDFENRLRKPLPLLPGALENLKTLKASYRLFLVTQGRAHLQKLKVETLGIGSYFDRLYIADLSQGESKGDLFRRICSELGAPAESFLSIGNRRSTDIREAKKCGMQTCLFCYGEHADEIASCPEDIPDFEIHAHDELVTVCKL